jgi:periplasmic protein TonB
MPPSDSSATDDAGPIRVHAKVPAPFAQVHLLEDWSNSRFARAFVLALCLHLLVGSRVFLGLVEIGDFARRVHAGVREKIRRDVEVDIQPEPQPEPEPQPVPEPEPEPEPEPAKPLPAKPPPAARPVEPPPAPAAAQAGRVLTAEPAPDEPLDLTDNAFVQGNADHYAGGITASKGTATQAVRNPAARPEGVIGGTGTAPAPAVDRSRAAGTVEKNWDCPFPAEAELEQINYQQVRVAVTVSAQGRALEVKVIGDSSFGFGRAAQRCALGKTFVPALDRTGNAITTTIPIVVTFVRR